MKNPNIGLSSEQLNGSVEVLNRVLADEYLLYTKIRKYHWNVKGIQFNDLHKFFQQMYEAADIIIDDTAERIRSLNGNAIGTATEFVSISRLKETPGDYPSAIEMIANLLVALETLILEIRGDIVLTEEKYKDAGTTDFLTNILEKHEKTAWMLRSMLDN